MSMNANGLLTIGEVIKRTGLTRKALRLYEQAGLVLPATRTTAGYRLYDATALPRLDLIRRARALDVSISELGELLDIAEGCSEHDHPALSEFVADKLRDTDRRLLELQALRQMLSNIQVRAVLEAPMDVKPVHQCGSPLCTCPVEEPDVPAPGVATTGCGCTGCAGPATG